MIKHRITAGGLQPRGQHPRKPIGELTAATDKAAREKAIEPVRARMSRHFDALTRRLRAESGAMRASIAARPVAPTTCNLQPTAL